MVKFSVFLVATAGIDLFQGCTNIAEAAEKNGFDSVWMPDHLIDLMPPTLSIVPDSWTILAGISSLTRRIRVGAITDPHRINPALLAQKLATLDQITKGRAFTGLGLGEAMNIRPLYVNWEKPLERLQEAVSKMRALWAGETVNDSDGFYKMNNTFLQIAPVQKPSIPIYVAANGKKSRALAGMIGDGWVPTWEGPTLFKKHLEEVRNAALVADRDPQKLDVCYELNVAISEDEDKAYSALDPLKPFLACFPKKLQEAYGVSLPSSYGTNFYSQATVNQENISKFFELGKFVTKEMVEDISALGSVDAVIRKIEKIVKAGATHIIVLNMGPDYVKNFETFGKRIIPYFSSRGN